MNDSDPKKQFGIQEDRPTDWFETLYAESDTSGEGVPWANMKPHPRFEEWLVANPLDGSSKTALVVGCGLGDDAIELESLGFDVTAFDVSEAAVGLCRKRFPQSKVKFLHANLFDEHPQWNGQFDFVLEIYTVQALPPRYERELIRRISDFVAPNGQLLVIASVVDGPRAFENGPPWKLTPQHVAAFESCGLSLVGQAILEDPVDGDSAYTSLFVRTGP